jgi:glycosyltransferase involved in cell wall biosynthesis
VADGLRHRQLSGYGMLARNLVLALAMRGHDVWLRASERPWEAIEAGARERLQTLPQVGREEREQADVVLQIRSPPRCSAFARPTLIYTQNALGGLPPEWVGALAKADATIVPSEYDRAVFARHLPRVHVARQSSDPAVFRPLPGERARGRQPFRFLYVGSYSFRKGVDLLLAAFLAEFSPQEPVELRLQCPGAGRADLAAHLRETLARLRPDGRAQLCSQELTPEEMCRLYNRSDCVVTLSRGEGWCMPLSEALLCGVPVIAPRSTGMVEYLDERVAELLPTHERPASEVRSRFAGTFATVYGHPGITYHEPDLRAARVALRRVYAHHREAVAKARCGRERLLGRFTWQSAAVEVERACRSVLAGDTGR